MSDSRDSDEKEFANYDKHTKESETGVDDGEYEITLAILPLNKVTIDQSRYEIKDFSSVISNSSQDSTEDLDLSGTSISSSVPDYSLTRKGHSQQHFSITYDSRKPTIPVVYIKSKILSSHQPIESSHKVTTLTTTRTIRVGESYSQHKTKVKTSAKKPRDMSNDPDTLFRPENFKTFVKPNDYLPCPPIHRLPDYPKIGFPQKWGVPVLQGESRSVQVGLSCPPAPLFHNDQLMTHAASTLRKYYNDSTCAVAKDWVKVQSRL